MTFAQDRPVEARAEPVATRTEARDVDSWLRHMEEDLPGTPAAPPSQLSPPAPAAAAPGPPLRQPQWGLGPEPPLRQPRWGPGPEPPPLRQPPEAPSSEQPPRAEDVSGWLEEVDDQDWLREDGGMVGPVPPLPPQPESPGSSMPSPTADARGGTTGPPTEASPPSPAGTSPPTGLANLDEVLKQLDKLYTGLAQMEQRLGSSEESYSKVVEKWQPPPSDPKPSDPE